MPNGISPISSQLRSTGLNAGSGMVVACPRFGALQPEQCASARAVNTDRPTCYNRPMRLQDYAPRPAHLKWLLDSDPAIRWQVMKDLTGETPDAIAVERSRVATEGWGAQLLARQSPNGKWGGREEDRGLLITFYSLV